MKILGYVTALSCVFIQQVFLNLVYFVFRSQRREPPAFRCLPCNKVFPSIIFLIGHNQIEHLTCKACNKDFPAADSLKKHRQEEPACHLLALENLPCEICSLKPSNSERLTHYETHKRDVDLLKCIFCLNSFKSHIDVVYHIQDTCPKYLACLVCERNYPGCLNLQDAINLYFQDFLDHLTTCWKKIIEYKKDLKYPPYTLSNLPWSAISVKISTPKNVTCSSASTPTSLPVHKTGLKKPPLTASIQSSTSSRKHPIENAKVLNRSSKIVCNVAQPSRKESSQFDQRPVANEDEVIFLESECTR